MKTELHPFRPLEIRFLSAPQDGSSADMLVLDHQTGHFFRMNLDGAEQLANALLEHVKKIRASKPEAGT